MEKMRKDEVAESLDRASRVACQGSPEARSGRFDELVIEQQFAQSLLREAQAACRSWQHCRAINDRLDSELQNAGKHLNMSGLGPVRMALARDAILLAFRLSDVSPKGDGAKKRITLCRAAALFDDDKVRERLASRQWVLDLGYNPELVDYEAGENRKRLARLRGLIVRDWSTGKPARPEFLELREALRPSRNRMAHAIEDKDNLFATTNQISDFIRMTLELATDFALVMTGNAAPAASMESHFLGEAGNFWDYAFHGPRAAYRKDMRARRSVGLAEEI